MRTDPFEAVGWVEADTPHPRQFTKEELKQFLKWKFLGACPLVSLFAKVSLWACGRIEEMTELRWDWFDPEGYVTIPADTAKWGKGKTVRLPIPLLREVERYRSVSEYVWAGYVDQLRAYHHTTGHHASAHKLKSFAPQRMKGSFQLWVKQWARAVKVEGLSHHAFRRTGLQWSREGQLRSSEGDYAKAVNVSQSVADKHYTSRPHRLWADLTYRNIVGEIGQDTELADLLGLGQLGPSHPPASSIEMVQEAIARNDITEATRLLEILRG